MLTFLMYGLSEKNKDGLIYSSFVYSVVLVGLLHFNDYELRLFSNKASTDSEILIVLSYFFLGLNVYLLYLFVSIFFDVYRFKWNFYYQYNHNLLDQKESILKRIHFLKKVYMIIIEPKNTIVGNIEKDRKKYQYMMKLIGDRDECINQYRKLEQIEKILMESDKKLTSNEVRKVREICFATKYNKLISTFSLEK